MRGLKHLMIPTQMARIQMRHPAGPRIQCLLPKPSRPMEKLGFDDITI